MLCSKSNFQIRTHYFLEEKMVHPDESSEGGLENVQMGSKRGSRSSSQLRNTCLVLTKKLLLVIKNYI